MRNINYRNQSSSTKQTEGAETGCACLEPGHTMMWLLSTSTISYYQEMAAEQHSTVLGPYDRAERLYDKEPLPHPTRSPITALRTFFGIAILAGSFTAAGCAIPIQTEGKEPRTIHHVIIGFGIVTVKQPNDISYLATSTQAVGMNISDSPGLKLGLGYSSSIGVTVSERAEDVRLEISQLPFEPFIVDTQSAILKRLKKQASTGVRLEEDTK
jgi:hypothetical protein